MTKLILVSAAAAVVLTGCTAGTDTPGTAAATSTSPSATAAATPDEYGFTPADHAVCDAVEGMPWMEIEGYNEGQLTEWMHEVWDLAEDAAAADHDEIVAHGEALLDDFGDGSNLKTYPVILEMRTFKNTCMFIREG